MKSVFVFACLTLAAALPAFATPPKLDPTECEALASDTSDRTDVAVFNHRTYQVERPAPAHLKVPDQGIFVVVFKNTDPTLFDYSLKALDEEAAKTVDTTASGQGMNVTRGLTTVCVSWRHLEEFPVYRVTITGRITPTTGDRDRSTNSTARLPIPLPGEPPPPPPPPAPAPIESQGVDTGAPDIQDTEPQAGTSTSDLLFPYTFPLWVETSDAQLSFSTGLGFSTLTNDRFFIKTDGTNKTVEKDTRAKDAFRPDLMAFATLTAPRTKFWRQLGGRLGLTFGLGIGEDSSPRYFLGPSLMLSHRMILSAGAIGAQVKRLPAGQALGKPPINGDNTLNSLDSGFKVGAALTISYKLTKDGTQFFEALNPSQKTTAAPPAQTPPANTPPADQ